MKQIIFTIILIFAFCFAAFAQTDKNPCTEIKFDLPNQVPFPEKPITFSVKVGGDTEKYKLSYEWTVSKGKILQGQGTSRIEFLAAEKDAATNVNVSVRVSGLPKDCPNTHSDIFGIGYIPEGDPIDRFGKIVLDDYKARLEGLRREIGNDPTAEGLITVTFDKKYSRANKISNLKKTFIVWNG